MAVMPKRRRGTGTVYQRGSVWWIQYYVRGRAVLESSGFTTKPDAENLLKQRIGARKNELRRIKWDQVDFEAKLIRLVASQTKGKQGRTLPIYGDMVFWLRKQQDTAPVGCPFVFHGSQGWPVDNHLRGWPEACERAGLPGLLFHDLRRSAVRNMKRAGIQDVVAMKISGHRTRPVFDRYYIVDETDMIGAGQKLEAFFEEKPGKERKPAKLKRVK